MMIYERGLLPIGRRVSEREYRTARPDSESGLIPREFSDSYASPNNTCAPRAPTFFHISRLVTAQVTVDRNIEVCRVFYHSRQEYESPGCLTPKNIDSDYRTLPRQNPRRES